MARFREYNSNRQQAEWIQVRIGIQRGTALLVNLNNAIDYFGSTVNKAARSQNLSKSDEVSFSEEVYDDQAFLTALDLLQKKYVLSLKVGSSLGQTLNYWVDWHLLKLAQPARL